MNILEKITGRQRKSIKELLAENNSNISEFYRPGFGQIIKSKVSAIEAAKKYSKLMILGKPGAGKTTFLKYLALLCIDGKFKANRIPLLITLKDFADEPSKPSLLEYITNLFDDFGFSQADLNILLKNGKLFLLLDGLDEIKEKDESRVITEIENFSKRFYFSSDFVIEYNSHKKEFQKNEIHFQKIEEEFNKKKKKYESFKSKFDKVQEGSKKYQKNHPRYEQYLKEFKESESVFKRESKKFKEKCEEFPDLSKMSDQGLDFLSNKFDLKTYCNIYIVTCRIAALEYNFTSFTEVEIADFDQKQIEIFVGKWFNNKKPKTGDSFLQKLSTNPQVEELANNPLLLTLLCLVFEDNYDFPHNRSSLYKDGISILLKKWDGERDIERKQIYKNLDSPRKEDLLSQIALYTFEKGSLFFNQDEVQKYIADYIRNLPEFLNNSEILPPDSELVLKAIEAQHGLLVKRARRIYSFSHLTFHEYFTARKIITTAAPKKLEEELRKLASHIGEKNWREVILLTLEMLSNASHLFLLIKEKIDSDLADEIRLQQITEHIQSNIITKNHQYKQSGLRAFMLAREYALQQDADLCSEFASELDSTLNQASDIADSLCNQDLHMSIYVLRVENLVQKINDLFSQIFNRYEMLNLQLGIASQLDTNLASKIELKYQINSIESQTQSFLYRARTIAQTNRIRDIQFNQNISSALALSLYSAYYKTVMLANIFTPELGC